MKSMHFTLDWRGKCLCQMNNAFPCRIFRSNALLFASLGASARMQGPKWRRNELKGRLKLDSTTLRRRLAKETSRWWNWQGIASQRARWAKLFLSAARRINRTPPLVEFNNSCCRSDVCKLHSASANALKFWLFLHLSRSPLRSSTKHSWTRRTSRKSTAKFRSWSF